jgi:hypothetical protein
MTTMKQQTKTLWYSLLLTILCANAQAAVTEVTATVDANPIILDESVNLIVTANDDISSNAFDPSPLLKDFVVGNTSVSRQTRSINFNTTRLTQWTTRLIPRNPGRYTIPAFTIDGQTSQPITLSVLPANASRAGRDRNLYVTTEVDSNEVYLQQQVRYTAKLYLAADLQRGSLAAPKLADAEIRQIGQDKEYNEIVDGKRFRIIERVFAIIPQKSGQFVIEGSLFEGEVADNTSQSFGFFSRTKTVTRLGPNIELNVLPIPQGYNSNWLPSNYIELNEEWQPDPSEYRVGEPITRTLTLTAVGLVEEQLPEINSDYPDSLKTYPEQPTSATVERDDSLIAQRVERIAIIPSTAGNISLPEVRVPWFNVTTKTTEYATLPSRTITVQPAIAQSGNIPTLQTEQTLSDTPVNNPSEVVEVAKTNFWSPSSWALLVLWLLTLLWAFKQRATSPKSKTDKRHSENTDDWKRLSESLKSNNPGDIQPALSRWLAILCGKPNATLPQCQQILSNEALNTAIKDMLQARYGRESQSWQANELRQVIQQIKKGQNNKPESAGTKLKPLYPTSA